MKLAYRITTPILAAGAVVMGIFLKLFTFVVGSTDDSINQLIGAVTHVLVEDPRRGYGVTIQDMLSAAEADERQAA